MRQLPDERSRRPGCSDAGHGRILRRSRGVRRSSPAAAAGQAVRAERCRWKQAIATPTTTWASTPIPTSSASIGRRSRTCGCAAAISVRCVRRTSRNCSCSRGCSSTVRPIPAPVRRAKRPEANLEECARSGVTAAQYGNILANPAEQYNGLVGGNPDLDPEESDTVFVRLRVAAALPAGPSTARSTTTTSRSRSSSTRSARTSFWRSVWIRAIATYCDRVNRAANGSIWLGDQGYIVDPIPQYGLAADQGHRC